MSRPVTGVMEPTRLTRSRHRPLDRHSSILALGRMDNRLKAHTLARSVAISVLRRLKPRPVNLSKSGRARAGVEQVRKCLIFFKLLPFPRERHSAPKHVFDL
jgi:hypothetical protein